MHYIFIDYENVQPKHLTPLMDVPCQVYIFVGALQSKLPVELVTQVQKLGEQARYVRISSSAKDALDFHIAYYVGKISAANPSGHYHILSNDKGYDPLIAHLRAQNIDIRRRHVQPAKAAKPIPVITVKTKKTPAPTAAPAPQQKPPQKLGTAEKVARIRKMLEHSQPNSEEKLVNLIKNQFRTSKDAEIKNLINRLRNKKIIEGRDEDISYPAIAS